jgi:hypothetical protein
MTPEQFEKVLERRLEITKKTLGSKGKEYASDKDRLHNFYAAGRLRLSHPCESLQGMMDKHLVSYFDIIEKAKNGTQVNRSVIDEKIGDIINYFILQEALLEDMSLVIDDNKMPNE